MGSDIRFASREKAIFGQPEVATGLIPGGGALDRLPLLVGRARAIEIILGADDYDADTAERYGWINRAICSRLVRTTRPIATLLISRMVSRMAAKASCPTLPS